MSEDKPYNPNAKAVHDFWRSNFDRFNEIIVTWEIKAHELKLASETLYRGFKEAIDNNMSDINDNGLDQRESFGSIWMMLCGYSLECLLKGLYFTINPNRNINNGKIVVDWKGSGHDLLTLVELCDEYLQDHEKTNFNEEEKNYLRRVSEYTLWAGKYPLPKKYQNMIPAKQLGGYAPLTLINVNQDKCTYESLYIKLTSTLERNNEQKAP